MIKTTDHNESTDSLKNSDDVSIADLISKFSTTIKYVFKRWPIILAITILGGLIGFKYSITKKPLYTASCSFVLEEAKGGSSMMQLGSLASLAGIDINGGGGGIFQGDNILELYKSRAMIEKGIVKFSKFQWKKTTVNRTVY